MAPIGLPHKLMDAHANGGSRRSGQSGPHFSERSGALFTLLGQESSEDSCRVLKLAPFGGMTK